MIKRVGVRGYFLIIVLLVILSSSLLVNAAGDRWQASGNVNSRGPFSMIIDTISEVIEKIFLLFRPLFEVVLGENFYSGRFFTNPKSS